MKSQSPTRTTIHIGLLAFVLASCNPDAPAAAQKPATGEEEKPPSQASTPNTAHTSTTENAPQPGEPSKPQITLADGTTQPVATMTRRLTGGATTVAGALRQLVFGLTSRLTPLDPTKPLRRPAYSPDQLAEALVANAEPITVTPIESTLLLLRSAQALGATAIPVQIATARAGATSLRHREYAVKITAQGFLGNYAVHRSAERNRAKSVELSPETLQGLWASLNVISLTEERRFDDAEAALRALPKSIQNDPGVIFLEGHLALLQGKSDEGLKAVKAAVEAAEDAHGLYLLGIAYLREESGFQAYAALKKASKLDPTYAEPLAALGAVLMERWHNTPEGLRDAVSEELDAVEAALSKIGKDAFGLVELRIQRLEAAGQRKKAKELGAEALNMFPTRATLHLLMSELSEADGEIAAMERHLERASEVDPEDAEPLMRLAELYAQRNEPDRLLKALAKASQRAPYDPDILDQLASTLHQMGRLKEAQKRAEELQTRFPDLPLGYVRLAELSIATGNAVGAAALVDKAIEKSPKDGDLHVLGYFAHTMAGSGTNADAVLSKYLAFDKDARMKIAEPLLQAGQFEAAVALLEAEVAANPGQVEAIISLAQLHAALKHPKDVSRLRATLAKVEGLPEGTLPLFDEAIRQVEAQAGAAPGTP